MLHPPTHPRGESRLSRQLARQFIDALHALEQSGDIEQSVAQYAEDATLDNVDLPEPMAGPDGAQRFRQDDRALFAEIRSEFSHVVGGDEAALEWTSRGTLTAGGEPIGCEGVTMLTFRGSRASAFRPYFDQ